MSLSGKKLAMEEWDSDDPLAKLTSGMLEVGGNEMGVACVSMGTVPCEPTICCCCFMMDCCREDMRSATEALLANGCTVTILVPGDLPGGLLKDSDVGILEIPWVFRSGLCVVFWLRRFCIGPLVVCGGEVIPTGRVAMLSPLL